MPDDSLLLSAAQICSRLSIGLSHLHGMRRAGRFPLQPIRLGKSVRFKATELSAWCDAGCPSGDRWRAMQTISMRLTV